MVKYASDPATLHSYLDGFLLGQVLTSSKKPLEKITQNPYVSMTKETKEADKRGLSLEKSEPVSEQIEVQLKLQPEVMKGLSSPKVEFAGFKDKEEQRPSSHSGKISNALGKG